MTTLFISDLHLSGQRPDITRLFIHFLKTTAAEAEALYILGDLFEVWLGDDMILPDYHEAINEMKSLTESGVPIYVMHGNRDFLLGETFSQLSGATLLEDPYCIDLYGTPTVLLHGDTLCTDDIEYQKFRHMVRNPQWQAVMLSKSPEERLALAKEYREISQSETGQKADSIMDVNQNAVEALLEQLEVYNMIHGHTHRPAIHPFELKQQNAQRIVLGDWYEQGSMLSYSADGFQLQTISD